MKESLTLTEIKDQYNRIKKTRDYLSNNSTITQKFIEFDKIIFLGCGSSYSLAKSFAHTTLLDSKKPCYAFPAGDVILRLSQYQDIFENSLVVSISRSGSTSEIVKVLEGFPNIKFYSIGITCKENSKMAELCDHTLEMPWAFDESVCQTSCVTNFYYVLHHIMNSIHNNSPSLDKILDMGDKFIEKYDEAFADLAKLPWENVVTLGDSQIYGIVEEGALAFKEICQLPSNSYNFLDVRHGPMVLINQKTLVIVPIMDKSTLEVALINDIIKKGATVITVSDEEILLDGTTNINLGFNAKYPLLGFPFINACQLLSLYKAYHLGINPDLPDGLDPWIKL